MKDKRAMKNFSTGNVEGTVLFIDIRNFLGISEILTPEKTCQFILQVIEPLSECIHDHKGYICQIQGDAVLAVFGLKDHSEDHATDAVKCALSLQLLLETMNPVQVNNVRIPLSASIGISTGELYACYIHVADRREFTVLGKTVNMAARFQQLNKHYNTKILIDEAVFAYIKEKIVTRKLDRVNIEGCNSPVSMYEVMFTNKNNPEMAQRQTHYKNGLVNYLRGEWDEAIECFSMVAEDKVCYRMLERCKKRKAFHEFIKTKNN